MAFPENPRDLKVGFAFGHSAAEDPTGLTYDVVSPNESDEGDPGPVLQRVTITRGRLGNNATTDATRIETSIRDTDGHFSPRNVTGQYYGQLRNGTPVEVAVDVGSGDVVLAHAAVPEFSPTWRGPDIDDQVSILALGVLARLGRDRDVYSWLRLDIGGRTATRAYWPMEDGERATQFGSGLSSGTPLTFGAIGSRDSGPVSSLPLPVFVSGTQLRAFVPNGDFTSGSWAQFWIAKFATAPTSLTTLMSVEVSGGSARRWVVAADSTTIYLTGLDANGSTVYSVSTNSPTVYSTWFSGEWRRIVLEVQNGVSAATSATDPTTGVGQGITISNAGIVAGAPSALLVPASTQLVGLAMGHIAFFDTIANPIPSSTINGQPGQSATERAWQICNRADIPQDIDFLASAESMGPQNPGTILSMLRDCEAADHGVLLERRDGRLGFDTRESRYNAPVALALEYGTEEDPGVVSDLVQFDDDRDLYNLITVSRLDGASAVAKKADGSVGTDETTGIGPRRLPVTLNLATDDRVVDHAGWLLAAGTINKPRYVIVLDFRANSDLADDVVACDIGSRITISGAPAKHAGPDDLDLIIEGEVLTLGADVGTVQWWCEPYDLWEIVEAGDPSNPASAPIIGSEGSTTNGGFVVGTTSLSVAIAAGYPLWPTGSVDFDIAISGARLHVTSISGASSPQTFTVDAAPVNGVQKTIPSGSAVAMADEVHYGL